MKKHYHFLKYSFVLAFLINTNLISAHGIALIRESGELLELSESHVDVQINNQIAVVKSTQMFVNKTGESIKIKYGYPLAETANPTNFRWRVNSQDWLIAEANASTQNPNLPTTSGGAGSGSTSSSNMDMYLGSNPMFFSPVNQIGEGDTLTTEITYVQLLEYSFGSVNFNYSGDYSLIQFDALEKQTFNINLSSDRNIDNFEVAGVEGFVINNQGVGANAFYTADFERAKSNISVTYELSSDGLGISSLSTFVEDSLASCDSYGNGFVSFIIEPESNADVEVIQKNFTLIIDKSGSMHGDKIEQARDAATFIVNNLNEGDYFNIIDFNNVVQSSFPQHELYSESSKIEAINFIDDIYASGITNISGSLSTAIEQFDIVDDTKANIIIFFTDGVATSGILDTESILSLVEDKVLTSEKDIFLFTFGIGDDVDKQLLTLLAVENNGIVNFLEDQDLEEEITEFFLKINNPVLIDIEMTIEPNHVIELYPSQNQLPNLYKGQQLIVSGRYSQPGVVNMNLKGKAFNVPVSYDFEIDLEDQSLRRRSFLPKIWAKQKIDALTLDFFQESNFSVADLISEEIDDISLCYNVISLEFNSFVDGNALEIEDLIFDAYLTDTREVLLEWSTGTEISNDKFIIERSSDAKEWVAIDEIESQGDSFEKTYYQFIDDRPLQGISYYRLKLIDLNGNVKYSRIKAVSMDQDIALLIYPNPLLNGQILNIQTDKTDNISASIYDVNGSLIKQKEI